MKKVFILLINFALVFLSCKKLVEIPPPTNTIVSEQAFSNDYNATASVMGIYSKLIDQSRIYSFGNGLISSTLGTSSDETAYFGSGQESLDIFYNQINSDNGVMLRLWQDAYATIYDANASIEQLAGNTHVNTSLRNQLIAEAKFIRSLCYFYLINIYGDVPFLTTTSYKDNSIAPKVTLTTIYSNIIEDLTNSIDALPDNFTTFNNERIRATKWSVRALLARIYLYTGDWNKAALYSDSVISNNNFTLVSDLNSVFLKNSAEAIFQLSIAGNIGTNYNVTPEAAITIPIDRASNPQYYLPDTFVSEFDSNDIRRISWVDSTDYAGTVYYIPYKYKVGPSDKVPNSDPTEYYMVFRLAEQYFIRAEAKAHKGDLSGAAADVNIIRARAGLSPISIISLDDAINKILEERKKELFYEWGHRWFDLKRTGKIDAVMSIVTPQKGGTWKTTAKLYPIPYNEVFTNSHLIQNPGY